MIRDYLKELKNKGNFSWSELSRLSGLPDATIRKIFSGETGDPRFETVVRLVTAMNGNLNELLTMQNSSASPSPADGTKACKSPSANGETAEIQEFIEGEENMIHALNALREVYEARIADIKSSAAEHIASLRRDKRVLAVAASVLTLFLISLLLVDLCIGTVGWIRY